MKQILFAFAAMLMLVACDPAQSAIDDLKALVEDVKVNGAEYTSDDWEELISNYEDVMENISDQELTSKQKREVGRLNAQFLKYAGTHYSKQLMNDVRDFGETLGDFVEGFLDAFDDDED